MSPFYFDASALYHTFSQKRLASTESKLKSLPEFRYINRHPLTTGEENTQGF